MILINLLPPHLRRAKTKGYSLKIDPRVLIAGGIFFVGLTLIFYLQYLLSLRTLKKLQTEWPVVQLKMQKVTQLQSEIEGGSKKEKEFIEGYVLPSFRTTSILSAVSELIPNSIWLIELKLTREGKENSFLLKGLSFATQRNSSIETIEKYLRDLKEKFPPDTRLMLTTSRQQREKAELTLFTAVFKWA